MIALCFHRSISKLRGQRCHIRRSVNLVPFLGTPRLEIPKSLCVCKGLRSQPGRDEVNLSPSNQLEAGCLSSSCRLQELERAWKALLALGAQKRSARALHFKNLVAHDVQSGKSGSSRAKGRRRKCRDGDLITKNPPTRHYRSVNYVTQWHHHIE